MDYVLCSYTSYAYIIDLQFAKHLIPKLWIPIVFVISSIWSPTLNLVWSTTPSLASCLVFLFEIILSFPSCFYHTLLIFLKKILLILLLERGDGWEKIGVWETHQSVASHKCQSRDPCMCPDREWNRWAFALQDDSKPTELHRSGQTLLTYLFNCLPHSGLFQSLGCRCHSPTHGYNPFELMDYIVFFFSLFKNHATIEWMNLRMSNQIHI